MAKHRVKMSEVVKSTQSVQESTERGGGKADYMKLGPKLNKVLILPPWNGKDLMKRLLVHQVWKGGKPVAMATSPRIEDGAEDAVMDYGFRLKEKYEDSPNKKKQDLWKKYMPSDSIVVNALDLNEPKPTPKVLRLPACAVKFLCDEVGEVADGDAIWDLEKGFPLIIKGNGKSGNNRRYEYAKFSKNAAALISEGRVDEDTVLDGLHDLDKLQPKLDDKKLKKVLMMLKQQDQSILNGEGEGSEEESEDDDDEKPARKPAAKRKASDDDDDDEAGEEEVDAEDDDDESDFEDEKPAKKKAKPAAKRKPADDDEEEESDEVDSEDDDDEDDRKPVKKNMKVAVKPKRKMVDEDEAEEDEEESEDEDLDEEALDDEEEEKPAKKKVQKKAAVGLRKKR